MHLELLVFWGFFWKGFVKKTTLSIMGYLPYQLVTAGFCEPSTVLPTKNNSGNRCFQHSLSSPDASTSQFTWMNRAHEFFQATNERTWKHIPTWSIYGIFTVVFGVNVGKLYNTNWASGHGSLFADFRCRTQESMVISYDICTSWYSIITSKVTVVRIVQATNDGVSN